MVRYPGIFYGRLRLGLTRPVVAALKTLALLSAIVLGLTHQATADWNEVMAKAIEKGSYQEIRNELKERSTGNPLETDFVNAVIAWKALGTKSNVDGILVRNFQGPLISSFGKNSPSAYSSLMGSSKVPDLAKSLLLQVLISKSRTADLSQAEGIRTSIKGVVNQATLPVSLRAAAIKGLPLAKVEANEDSTYLPYMRRGDSTLMSSAYWALGQRIRMNIEHNRQSENAQLFLLLKGIADSQSTILPIRALAQLGMDPARDYLAVKCSGDPEKILIVLKHDPYMKHAGLLTEALKLERDPIYGQEIRFEIHTRVRQPDGVVASLLGADNSRIEAGLNLLGDFPELIPKYATAIEGFKTSSIAPIKTAALALGSPLPTTSEAAK